MDKSPKQGFRSIKNLDSFTVTLKEKLKQPKYNTGFDNIEIQRFQDFDKQKQNNICFIKTCHPLLTTKKVIENVVPDKGYYCIDIDDSKIATDALKHNPKTQFNIIMVLQSNRESKQLNKLQKQIKDGDRLILIGPHDYQIQKIGL